MERNRALLTALAVISAIVGPLLLWRLRPPPTLRPALHAAEPAALSPACAPRGPVVFQAASASEISAIAEEFRRRNGAAWQTLDALPRGAAADVDPITRTVRSSDRTAAVRGARPSAEEARTMATYLVRRNADLLGIWPDEIDLLAITVRPEPGGAWSTTLQATTARPGFEAFPSLRRTILVQLIMSETRRTLRTGAPPLPLFELCTIPLLRPEDPAVRREIVGRESLGRPAEADITGAPELIIDEVTTPEATTLTLGYLLIVMQGAYAHHVVVDADTGRFLREQPCAVSKTCATAAPSAPR